MDTHWDLIFSRGAVVNVLVASFDRRSGDKFVVLSKINLFGKSSQGHQGLLDHIEKLNRSIENEIENPNQSTSIETYQPEQMHKLYDL